MASRALWVDALDAVADRAGKPGRQLALQSRLIGRVGPAAAWRWRRHMALKAPTTPSWRGDRYHDLWVAAAAVTGCSWRDLPGGFLELERDGRITRVWSNLVPLDDPVTLRLAGTRPVAHALFDRAGVPVAPHESVHWRDHAAAEAFLETHGTVVVKPAASTGRGTGVTCGVRTADALRDALLRAAGWDTQVMLEAQITGVEHRLLVLDGQVIAAVRRDPPTVVGDGSRCIGELIAAENQRRREARGRRALWPIRIDLDCVLTLEGAGLGLRSVPPAGTTVSVKTAVNENAAHDNATVDPVPPSLAALGEAAAAALGARLLSVEIVAEDVDPDHGGCGGVVIEVNTTPGLLYHVQVRDPATAVNPAVALLESLLEEPSR